MQKAIGIHANSAHCSKASQAPVLPSGLLRNSRSFKEFQGSLAHQVRVERAFKDCLGISNTVDTLVAESRHDFPGTGTDSQEETIMSIQISLPFEGRDRRKGKRMT